MLLRMHHDNLVPYSPELDGVTNEDLQALSRHQLMFLISHHEPSYQPQFFTRIRLLVIV